VCSKESRVFKAVSMKHFHFASKVSRVHKVAQTMCLNHFQSAFVLQEVVAVISRWLSADFQTTGFTATVLQY